MKNNKFRGENKFLKLFTNSLYGVIIGVFIAALVCLIVSLLIPLFSINYYGLGEEKKTIIQTDSIGFIYSFEHMGEWFAIGTKINYDMFIQYCFMISICLGLGIVCAVASFVLGILKEKMSQKIEFVGGALGITSAIGGFAALFLLILSFSACELPSKVLPHSKTVINPSAGFYLLIAGAVLLIVAGALLTSMSSEKTFNDEAEK